MLHILLSVTYHIIMNQRKRENRRILFMAKRLRKNVSKKGAVRSVHLFRVCYIVYTYFHIRNFKHHASF